MDSPGLTMDSPVLTVGSPVARSRAAAVKWEDCLGDSVLASIVAALVSKAALVPFAHSLSAV